MPEGGPAGLDELRARIAAEGGVVVGAYLDPLGGLPLVLAVLPIDKVEPTPFQRDLSDAHHKRLADVIQKTGRFLDPVITALVVPSREVAWQILALNTEKAHNLKERSLEVIRIYRGLLEEDGARPESSFAFYLEDAALVTLGVCYELQPRFAGGAYHPVLRRVESFREDAIEAAIGHHERLARLTLAVEEKVAAAVARLKEKGLTSPYLRSFVVARINPLRWIKGDAPPAEEVLETMRARAAKFNTEKVLQEDLVSAGGVPDEE
jgi:ParB family chromosome partitioning protein